MSKNPKTDQDDREKEARAAREAHEKEAERFPSVFRAIDSRREAARHFNSDLANDAQLAARAGHSFERRHQDIANRYRARNAAQDDDELLELFVMNRRTTTHREVITAAKRESGRE